MSKFYPNISELKIERAIENGYKLVGLQENNILVAIAEIYFYPHLTDEKRGWIHNLIAIEDQKSQQYKTKLLTYIKNSYKCTEIAVHVPVEDNNTNQFYLREGGQHSALAYEWNKFSHLEICQKEKQINSDRAPEFKIADRLEETLELLRYFHPNISREILDRAIKNNLRIFGLWNNNKLCSVATLIFYPHLNDDRRVWLQDGMVLPVKGYRENASKLLDRVLNFCFNNGISTVNLHVRVKNKRTQKFYAEKGGKYRANVYKWKI